MTSWLGKNHDAGRRRGFSVSWSILLIASFENSSSGLLVETGYHVLLLHWLEVLRVDVNAFGLQGCTCMRRHELLIEVWADREFWCCQLSNEKDRELAHHVKKSQRAEVALWQHRWHVENPEDEYLDLEDHRRRGVP